MKKEELRGGDGGGDTSIIAKILKYTLIEIGR